MDLTSLRSLALGINFSVHGVDATVTPPGGDAVETRVIWLTEDNEDQPPGSTFSRGQPLLGMAFLKADVPTCQRGTQIEAPPRQGGAVQTWTVDGFLIGEAEHWRVRVVAGTEPAS